ncbi:hypothetical protein M0D69_03635 [Caballeronia sp. SEWSISQ10-4 2]|uniref:hypothetical protein n=1 Tax=Caballeronia sp. SEWSISQ10-4 2 TaxID=2937438 RepID=UPI00265724D3|nr:hypothetical protein [Caballeronia sp. SEWSISQ10-4 2]MDN7177115.1 hypothetical protein [Caballeronia sp. SEWSISQ10-4 2]
MKVHRHPHLQVHPQTTNPATQAANAQTNRRRRMGQAIEPGEAHHSAELEELVHKHHQFQTSSKRKTSRRKGDVENPEESQGEAALETETMVLQAYAREAKSLVVKVGSREGGDQKGGSQSNHEGQPDGKGLSKPKSGGATVRRGVAMQQTAQVFAEMAKHADLPWTQARLLELARVTRIAAATGASAPDPVERAMTLMQLYLTHCSQRTTNKAPRTTLAAVRTQLIDVLQQAGAPELATRLPADALQARQIERFHLFLPLWLLQLHRPRLTAHIGPAVARSQVIAGYSAQLAV